jgi:hypothetical protein
MLLSIQEMDDDLHGETVLGMLHNIRQLLGEEMQTNGFEMRKHNELLLVKTLFQVLSFN